jgi:hypothetical protein
LKKRTKSDTVFDGDTGRKFPEKPEHSKDMRGEKVKKHKKKRTKSDKVLASLISLPCSGFSRNLCFDFFLCFLPCLLSVFLIMSSECPVDVVGIYVSCKAPEVVGLILLSPEKPEHSKDMRGEKVKKHKKKRTKSDKVLDGDSGRVIVIIAPPSKAVKILKSEQKHNFWKHVKTRIAISYTNITTLHSCYCNPDYKYIV